MKLYKEINQEGKPPLEEAGLYDVCQWVIDSYPDDIFIGGRRKGKLLDAVVKMRIQCRRILRLKQ